MLRKYRKITVFKIGTVFLIPLTLLLILIAKISPQFTEIIYSRGIHFYLSQILGVLFSLLPISYAELFLYIGVLLILLAVIRAIIRLIRVRKQKGGISHCLKRYALNIVSVSAILFFFFELLFGLNYYRRPLYQTLQLPVKARPHQELRDACYLLTEQAAQLRYIEIGLTPDESFRLPYPKTDALLKVPQAYSNMSWTFQYFYGKYSTPKPIAASKLLCYTGIAGIFIPYTVEANVNMEVTDAFLPVTAMHEAAHQRGFAREDEAEFIASLACIFSPDPYVQYSGTLSALQHALTALYHADPALYEKAINDLPEGILKDLNESDAFWEQFQGPVGQFSSTVNDVYLKANGMTDGSQSYGRMIDLLLALFDKISYGQLKQSAAPPDTNTETIP